MYKKISFITLLIMYLVFSIYISYYMKNITNIRLFFCISLFLVAFLVNKINRLEKK